MLLAAVLGTVGGVSEVPYVALGPGPTYNTLGAVNGTDVIAIDGTQSHSTAGHLNMTTVSVSDGVTLFGALGRWLSGRHALVPREEIYPPDLTDEQVDRQNRQAFQDSEDNAAAAALRHLDYPTKVVVNTVVADAPADGRLMPGDMLLAVDGDEVSTADDVRTALADSKPEQRVQVRYRRGPVTGTTAVTLAARDDREHGFLGVEPVDHPDVQFEIKIRLADVGGPSAGLMFALAIVDKLTEGQLNGGEFIAGTGEIDSAGRVGPVGGVPFKMVAANEAGADVFLVPAANCLEAEQRAPDGLRLVRVEDLDSAVAALDTLRDGGDPPSC